MRQRILAISLLLTALASGCASNSVEDLAKEVACTPDSVSFSQHIMPILERSCTDSSFGPNCHFEGSMLGDFTTYDGVKPYVDFGNFQDYVLENKWMPPAFSSGPRSLSECQLDSIEIWVADGAQDN